MSDQRIAFRAPVRNHDQRSDDISELEKNERQLVVLQVGLDDHKDWHCSIRRFINYIGTSRLLRSILLALMVAAALVPSARIAWRWRAMPQAGRFHDDGIYLVTAKSLASGNGYRIESFPGQPAQTKYPPVFPLMLSLVWQASPDFPGNLPYFALLVWLMLPALIIVMWCFFRQQGFEDWETALLCSWAALTPALTGLSVMILSELLFTILLTATLLASERGRVVAAGLL